MNSSFRLFGCITALLCFLICLFFLTGAYIIISIIPVFYCLFLLIIDSFHSLWRNRPLSVYIITILLWVRMVLLPFYGAVAGNVSGAYHSDTISIELQQFLLKAVFLCIYDSIAIVFVLFVASTKIKKSTRALNTIGLFGQKEIYILFCLMALAVFILVGREMHLYDFAIKPVEEGMGRSGDIIDSRELFVREIVGTGISFFFILLLSLFCKKYGTTHSNKYYILSVLCALVFISIISGERRTTQLYKGFTSLYLLLSLYPQKRKKITTSVGIYAILILALMTIYKQFGAFYYGSYSEAIQNAELDRGLSCSNVDAYFYGIDTIAKNLYYSQLMSIRPSQLLFDFFRNFFGINFFIHGGGLLTTQMYNAVIYYGDQLTGLLLSSVGYGYLFGGYILAPLATVINVIIVLFLERCLRSAKSFEWQFVFAMAFIRYAFGVLSAMPPLINYITRMLFINGLIILIARFAKKRIVKHE